jgi:dTDP-4-dehydrorhamnose reductase
MLASSCSSTFPRFWPDHLAPTRPTPERVIHAAYAGDQVTIVDATRNVVDAAREVDADVLYVSSDAVFSGDGLPRHEDASPDPVWDYGRWKARAERIVAGGVETSTIVRLPLIVSLDPEDHVVARIRQGAAPEAPTSWFVDELRQPAAASELAEALWRWRRQPPAADRTWEAVWTRYCTDLGRMR